jgi:hypothetical protein
MTLVAEIAIIGVVITTGGILYKALSGKVDRSACHDAQESIKESLMAHEEQYQKIHDARFAGISTELAYVKKLGEESKIEIKEVLTEVRKLNGKSLSH